MTEHVSRHEMGMLITRLINSNQDLEAQIQRIKDLHDPINLQGGVFCAAEHVSETSLLDGEMFDWYTAPYPCDTIKALEGIE